MAEYFNTMQEPADTMRRWFKLSRCGVALFMILVLEVLAASQVKQPFRLKAGVNPPRPGLGVAGTWPYKSGGTVEVKTAVVKESADKSAVVLYLSNLDSLDCAALSADMDSEYPEYLSKVDADKLSSTMKETEFILKVSLTGRLPMRPGLATSVNRRLLAVQYIDRNGRINVYTTGSARIGGSVRITRVGDRIGGTLNLTTPPSSIFVLAVAGSFSPTRCEAAGESSAAGAPARGASLPVSSTSTPSLQGTAWTGRTSKGIRFVFFFNEAGNLHRQIQFTVGGLTISGSGSGTWKQSGPKVVMEAGEWVMEGTITGDRMRGPGTLRTNPKEKMTWGATRNRN